MNRSIRPDAVLVQAVIAGALSFAHLHDLAAAAGQDGWKAWAYPVSVDLLLVAAWRRMRSDAGNRDAWFWFAIALTASLGANVATAGLLDMGDVPDWLRILVAGWPALAFLGGTLLAHAPGPTTPEPEPTPEPLVPAVEVQRIDQPDPVPAPAESPAPPEELAPAPAALPADAPAVPRALLDHARSIADAHRASTGQPISADALSARLGLPGPTCNAIAAQLQLA
ncbi:DUF2637 domain-containing protein [Streptomyces solicathayae]|uniref:DUF2637 domain-containing protein n=1 Tax=Streptomyces solicathayae TaxID=3081768 RepID=A0ABZ0LVJ0_9ACTN|nr:DUF2637 domain-containing protein [Streptomyces sp. HUAS YS2]WOX23355.1 DUF2637 domain-containing protein [Streptomyces sp. HUAS YS2]